MRDYRLRIVPVITAIFAVLLLCAPGQAQRRNARGREYSKADVDRIIKRVEDRSDKFKKEFDKALDRSRLNGTNREDQLNQYARDLEHATDDLRHQFDRSDRWIDNREQVRTCLALAAKINVALRNRRLGSKVESTWAALRFDLNTLAQVYNLPGVA